MKMQILLQHKTHTLHPRQLIQSGGEGMVFSLGRDAVKIYHQPRPGQAAKLRAWLARFAGRVPPNVLGPTALVTNRSGAVLGFQMARLPAGSLPLRQLAGPKYAQQSGLTAADVIPLFQQLHQTLSVLHQLGLVVGDLNDQNIHFHPAGQGGGPALAACWLDVDSYQFEQFPCPVALESCLDPHLYHVTDFGARPVFSPASDWYAYFVLLVKALLLAHPYGGVHHQAKSLAARATAGLTILDPAVTYPKLARPAASLPDDLLHHLHQVFGLGQRPPFPRQLLDDFAAALVICSRCGLAYPAGRSGCPGCHHLPLQPKLAQPGGQLQVRLLAQTGGHFLLLAAQPDRRIVGVVREGAQYSLLRLGVGGLFDRQPLFSSQAGYRFGLFGHYLVVNPAGQSQLLLLDTSHDPPQRLALLASDPFQGGDGAAIFATSPLALYRLASGALLRGSVRGGLYAEEVVATAHQQQTLLWAAPEADIVAGIYRIFGDYTLFWRDEAGVTRELPLPLAGGESVQELHVVPGRTHLAVLAHLKQAGRAYSRYWLVDAVSGHLAFQAQHPAGSELYGSGSLGQKALWGSTLLHPTDAGVLKESPAGQTLLPGTADVVTAGDTLLPHPAGLLVQRPGRVYLVTA